MNHIEHTCALLFLVFAFYLWHMFGVTVGLHRLLSHRAFRCNKFIEYFFVIGAYLAFHGSPIWWATIHRTHHRHVDTPLDPHSPNQGILHAYAFFRAFRYPPHIDPLTQSPDLMKDPLYRALEMGGDWKIGYATCVASSILFRVVLWACFGWQVAACSMIAALMALNVPLILNIICHIPRSGYRNYESADDSQNVWWLGIIALGDGWHNNHHAHPGSSQMGLLRHEFDASWALLRFLSYFGLVSNINESMEAPVPVALHAKPVAPSRTPRRKRVLVGKK